VCTEVEHVEVVAALGTVVAAIHVHPVVNEHRSWFQHDMLLSAKWNKKNEVVVVVVVVVRTCCR
jgi:hypothetical protein